MENSMQTNPQKSILWIVAIIIGNMIMFAFIGLIILFVLRTVIPQSFSGIASVLFLLAGAFIGVRFVKKKTTVAPSNILKIALAVIALPVLFQIGVTIFGLTNQITPNPLILLQWIIYDVVLFGIVYFLLKK